MQNDERRTRNEDQPDSNAAFHALPGDLADTENAAARENRLSGPGGRSGGTAGEGHAADGRRGTEAPEVIDEAADDGQRSRVTEGANPRDVPDTWTTKGNPLA